MPEIQPFHFFRVLLTSTVQDSSVQSQLPGSSLMPTAGAKYRDTKSCLSESDRAVAITARPSVSESRLKSGLSPRTIVSLWHSSRYMVPFEMAYLLVDIGTTPVVRS